MSEYARNRELAVAMVCKNGVTVSVTVPGEPVVRFWYDRLENALSWMHDCEREGWTVAVEPAS